MKPIYLIILCVFLVGCDDNPNLRLSWVKHCAAPPPGYVVVQDGKLFATKDQGGFIPSGSISKTRQEAIDWTWQFVMWEAELKARQPEPAHDWR